MPWCGGRNGQDLPKEYNKCVKAFHIQIPKPEKTKYKKGEEKIDVDYGNRVRETADHIIDGVIEVAQRENVTPYLVSEIQESKVYKEKVERSENVRLDLQDEIKKLKKEVHDTNEETHRLKVENRKYAEDSRALHEEVEKFKEANSRIVEEKIILTEDVKRLEKEKRKYADEKQTSGEEVEKLREEIRRNKEENETLKEDVKRLTDKNRETTEENQALIQEIEKKHTEQIENLKQQNKEEATQLTEEITSLQRNVEWEKKAKEDFIAKLKDEEETSQNKINALERDNQIKADQYASLQLQVEQYEAKTRQYMENLQRQFQQSQQSNGLLQRQLQQQEAQSRQTIDHLQSSINAEKRAKEDALTRLSAAAASKLRDKNPGITDLSDPNRPLKLSEKTSELYDNEWTNAMEQLEGVDVEEKEGIEILLNIITTLFDHLSVLGDRQLENLSKMIVMPDFDHQMNEEIDLKKIPDLPIEILKPLKDFRKKHADLAIQRLQKKLTKDLLEDKLKKNYLDSCSEYIASCIELVWLMRVQDPPVHIEWNIKTDDDFDTNIMRSYTKSGKYVDFVVWPILYLHKGGPLLCKGVVQGKKKKNVGEAEQLLVQDKPSESENYDGEKQFDEGNTQDDSGIQVQREDAISNHGPSISPDIDNDSHGDDMVKIQNDEANVSAEPSPSQVGTVSDPSMSLLGDDSPVIPSASMAAATCEETCVEVRNRSRSSGQSSQGSDSKETYHDARDGSGSGSEQTEADESFSDCNNGEVRNDEGKMDEELD